MFPVKAQTAVESGSETYPLGEHRELSPEGPALALVTLSHTQLEHRLYSSMLAEASARGNPVAPFSIRKLMALANVRSASTVRRGLDGLIAKLSIERQDNGHNGNREEGRPYLVRAPEEILARRSAMGVNAFPLESVREANLYHQRVIKRVVALGNLSRREAQVALYCVQGLTNAEIGLRLKVSEQTVKFHLRHVFIKFSVRRRAELISRLLM